MVLGKLDNYLQKTEITTFSNTIYRSKLKTDKDLNVRLDTVKFLEENRGSSDISCSNIFSHPFPKVSNQNPTTH